VQICHSADLGSFFRFFDQVKAQSYVTKYLNYFIFSEFFLCLCVSFILFFKLNLKCKNNRFTILFLNELIVQFCQSADLAFSFFIKSKLKMFLKLFGIFFNILIFSVQT
jgi:hypothetical protein